MSFNFEGELAISVLAQAPQGNATRSSISVVWGVDELSMLLTIMDCFKSAFSSSSKTSDWDFELDDM